jgi:hypothetical protein
MSDAKRRILERIEKDPCFAVEDGEASVVAITTGGYVMCGDVIEDVINSSHARKTVSNLCTGAKMMWGSNIHVVFRDDGKINVVKYQEFLEMFPTKEYKSPIAL